MMISERFLEFGRQSAVCHTGQCRARYLLLDLQTPMPLNDYTAIDIFDSHFTRNRPVNTSPVRGLFPFEEFMSTLTTVATKEPALQEFERLFREHYSGQGAQRLEKMREMLPSKLESTTGLRLEAAKVPVEVLVIAEKPSGN